MFKEKKKSNKKAKQAKSSTSTNRAFNKKLHTQLASTQNNWNAD